MTEVIGDLQYIHVSKRHAQKLQVQKCLQGRNTTFLILSIHTKQSDCDSLTGGGSVMLLVENRFFDMAFRSSLHIISLTKSNPLCTNTKWHLGNHFACSSHGSSV